MSGEISAIGGVILPLLSLKLANMDLESYTLAIGKIVVNLHSLEFSLRAFLSNYQSPTANWLTGPELLKVGQKVSVTAFSNYDTLGRMIETFNSIMGRSDASLKVDPDIVNLRDILAHGRIWASVPHPPMQLIKFAKPKNDTAEVTHAELIDDAWLSTQRTRVFREVKKVQQAGQMMQPSKWPTP